VQCSTQLQPAMPSSICKAEGEKKTPQDTKKKRKSKKGMKEWMMMMAHGVCLSSMLWMIDFVPLWVSEICITCFVGPQNVTPFICCVQKWLFLGRREKEKVIGFSFASLVFPTVV